MHCRISSWHGKYEAHFYVGRTIHIDRYCMTNLVCVF